MGDVGNTSRLWGIPSQPLAALPEPGVGLSQQPEASSDPGDGHLAIWDHIAFAAALGAVVGRSVGYCEGESFDVKPVFGHVALWSLLSLWGMEEDNPYTTRHTSKQAADRLWDTPLISAGVGALWGAITESCDEHEDRIPREQIVITGAVVVGATGLVLDILHKNGDGEDPSTVSLRVSPNLQPRGAGVSIQARF